MNFDQLKKFHAESVERLAKRNTELFEKRIGELLIIVRIDIPELNGIVSCNGSTWAVGFAESFVARDSVKIKYRRDSLADEGENPIIKDSIRFLLDYHPEHGTGGDQPVISERARKALDEICEIVAHMSDSRSFTLNDPEVLFLPVHWK